MKENDFYIIKEIPEFQVFMDINNISNLKYYKPYNAIYNLDTGIIECSVKHLVSSNQKTVSTYILKMAYLPDHFIEDISFFGIWDKVLIKEHHKTFKYMINELEEKDKFFNIIYPIIEIEEYYNCSGGTEYKVIITGKKEVSNRTSFIEDINSLICSQR